MALLAIDVPPKAPPEKGKGALRMKQTRKLLALVLCLLFVLPAFPAAVFAADTEICNVIFMIGDGMGYNHLKLAEEQGYEIFMDDAPDLLGWSRTRSASSAVTDSAAGATALACGVRTNNGMLGVFPDANKLKTVQARSVTENAIMHRMKTGIVTTDLTSGATPAGYSVHTDSRNNTEEIIRQQLAGRIDLIFGKQQSVATQAAVEAAGFCYLPDRAAMQALTPGTRGYGQFGTSLWKLDLPDAKPSLLQMSEKAIALLSDNNPNGFFLMIEGAHIDKNADDSKNGEVDYPDKLQNTAQAVKTFDNAVRCAVDFARRDGHTLVIITADHETGDLQYEEVNGRMTFHSAKHSAANVPVFVYGARDLFENGSEMDNRDLPNLIAAKLGWSERFPIEDPAGTIVEPLPEPEKEKDEPGERAPGFFARLLQWLRALLQRLIRLFR